jgi:NAD(P)-dependent dehydrogenase (short-subunit alcohol dehydrogenase family)
MPLVVSRVPRPSYADWLTRAMGLDVTDATSIKAELEGQAIDLLLNNAGVMGPRGQTIGNIDYDAWAKVLDANTMGPMRVSESFVDHVARRYRKLMSPLPRHGIACRQYFRRFDRLLHLKGRGEHGDAQSGHRPRTTRHHMCESGLSAQRQSMTALLTRKRTFSNTVSTSAKCQGRTRLSRDCA